MVALAAGSAAKAWLLQRLLGAPVTGWRPALLWASLAATAVGAAFTSLPKRFEWAELLIGEPAIAAVYGFLLWKLAFSDEDRALFRRMPGAGKVQGEGQLDER